MVASAKTIQKKTRCKLRARPKYPRTSNREKYIQVKRACKWTHLQEPHYEKTSTLPERKTKRSTQNGCRIRTRPQGEFPQCSPTAVCCCRETNLGGLGCRQKFVKLRIIHPSPTIGCSCLAKRLPKGFHAHLCSQQVKWGYKKYARPLTPAFFEIYAAFRVPLIVGQHRSR